MRFMGLALGVGVLWGGAVACGGSSASHPATEPPTASAGANLGGSAGAGVAGKPSQGGAASGGTGGTAGTAGTAGQPPKSGCPMDLSSWTVETCYPIAAVPVEQPAAAGGAASGGAASGGATGEGGEGGASEPVCPAMPLPGPFDPPPVVKGDQCCYYRTQFCG